MNISIVIADYSNPQHAKDIGFLLNAYACDPMGGGKPLPETTVQNVAKELGKLSYAFSFICYVDNNPAALMNCLEAFSSFKCKPLINVHDLVVVKKFRGLGISQKLFAKLDEIALEKGCCKITLEVLEGNEVARNAYAKAGFKGYELDPKMGKAMFLEKVF